MKFKVLKEFVLNGIVQKFDSVIELDNQQASLKSIQENIEKIVIDPSAPKIVEGELGNIVIGETLTPEQKEKLAKENIIETAEAQRLAAEHRARDMAEGNAIPPVQVVADLLKEKLLNEEFIPKDNTPTENPIPTE